MSAKKSFDQLSKRQQRRILAEEFEKDMEYLDSQLEIDSSDSDIMLYEKDNNEHNSNVNVSGEIRINPADENVDNILTSENEVEIPIVIEESTSREELELYSNEYEVFLKELSLDEVIEDLDNIGFESFDDVSSDEDDGDLESMSNESGDDNFDLNEALSSWQQECLIPRESMNKLLLILREAGHTELPKDSRTLLNTPSNTIISSCPPGQYMHYGLKQSLIDILSYTKLQENIVIDVNIDGLPITKSTSRTLWPIQGKIIDKSYFTVFVIGVYHGTKKPDSVEVFLKTFIEEYLQLNQEGFEYKNINYTVTLRCVVCDSPAANFVTCTKYYNGYFGCRKCMEEGEFMRRMVFLNEHAKLRTNENFRNRVNPEHHNGASPFERLNVDMVHQFPLDYMHLVCLGVTKLLITMWLKIIPGMTVAETKQLSTAFTDLAKYVPSEFNRKPQSLLEFSYWKATTFRFFLLYAGSIIIEKHIPKDMLEHFNYFSCAIRILCDPSQCHINNEFARELLVKFVQGFKTLYGKDYITSNVHNLIHLSTDVINHGTLDNFSAFPFENNMLFIKKLLRKNEKPLQQIHRRLSEKLRPSNKRNYQRKNYPVLLQKIRRTLPFNCTNCHKKIEFKHFQLTDSIPNNCCVLNSRNVILIESIAEKDEEIVVIAKQFLQLQTIKNYPIDSTEIGIWRASKLSASQVIPVKTIRNKACLLIHNNNNYVISLLHD